MNKTTKIILGVTAGVVVVCLIVAAAGFLLARATGRALGSVLLTDANKVAEISGTIAEYTLPSGFGNGYASQVAGYTLVGYTGSDGHSHVYFFQLPAGVKVEQAEIERQLNQAVGEPAISRRSSQVVSQTPATICGQQTNLVVSEGINSDNQPFRQVSALFQGKGGQAAVTFERPLSSWDQAEVDAFLRSIR